MSVMQLVSLTLQLDALTLQSSLPAETGQLLKRTWNFEKLACNFGEGEEELWLCVRACVWRG